MSGTVYAASTTTRGAGPLTTVFTTPEFCASSAWNFYDVPPLSSSICMPNGFTGFWNYKTGFYSPGICPESYTQGCAWPTSFAVESNGTPFIGGPLESGETAIICCPTGYKCMSDLSDNYEYEYAYSKCIATTSSTYVLALPTVTSVTTTPLVYAIQVRWQSSDLNNLETNPTKYGETITPTSTAASTGQTSNGSTASATRSSIASPTGESTSLADDSSISTGAAIGIGVGVGAGVIAVCLIAFLLLWKRRSKSKQATTSPDGKGFTELQDTETARRNNAATAELASPEGTWNDTSTIGDSTMVSPLTARPETATAAGAAEMGAGVAATEMEVPNNPHELAGHVTDFAELPASNEFVAELPGDTPLSARKRWN